MRVLVADDEESIRMTLRDFFEEIYPGVVVEEASDGLDAFLKCLDQSYKVIVTDHKMPLMKGTELAIALKAKKNANRKTPVILFSGYIDEEVKNKLSEFNVEFEDKPLDYKTLFAKIDKHMRN